MKKSIIFALLSVLFLASCEKRVENELAGHRFECRYGSFMTSSYSFSEFDYTGFYSATTSQTIIIDFYYTFSNNIIKMYYDKEKTDLMATAEYRGDCIIVDGEEEFPFEKKW